MSRYIGNISGDFGKYRPAKKTCKKFEKNILNISRYIGRFWKISGDFGKYRPAKKNARNLKKNSWVKFLALLLKLNILNS